MALLPEPVLAWRSWVLVGHPCERRTGYLHAEVAPYCWHAGVNVASWPKSMASRHGSRPLGFFAYHRLEDLVVHHRVSLWSLPIVARTAVGIVQMGGHIDVHRLGLTAQHARVVALLVPDSEAFPFTAWRYSRRIKAIARRYDDALVLRQADVNDGLRERLSGWGRFYDPESFPERSYRNRPVRIPHGGMQLGSPFPQGLLQPWPHPTQPTKEDQP